MKINKVLLINPPIREWSRPNVPPLGLAYLASALRDRGYEAEILDINAYRWPEAEVKEKLERSDADCFGVGSLITLYGYVKRLVRLIKSCHPKKPVVVGNSVASSLPGLFLDRVPADAIVMGEGEEILLDLMEAFAGRKEYDAVAGIGFRYGQGGIRFTAMRPLPSDLDEIPYPAWELLPMEEVYFKNYSGPLNRHKWMSGNNEITAREISQVSSRGCPYPCIYCYHDRRWRARSAASLVEEIRFLRQTYRIDSIQFLDDCFVIDKERVREFCRLIKKADLGAGWGVNGRLSVVDEELLRTMKESGCTNVDYGVESGSQRILDRLKKCVTVEQMRRGIALTERIFGASNIHYTFTMMIGSPDETRESVEESIRFCRELGVSPEAVFFTTPFPGTPLYEEARAKGLIPDEEEYLERLGEMGEELAVNLTGLPDKELVALKEYLSREVGARNLIKHGNPSWKEAKGEKREARSEKRKEIDEEQKDVLEHNETRGGK